MNYKLEVYEEGTDALLASYESSTPFLAMHVGEILDIESGSQGKRSLEVKEIRHVIVFSDGNMVHILGVVCAAAPDRSSQPSDT